MVFLSDSLDEVDVMFADSSGLVTGGGGCGGVVLTAAAAAAAAAAKKGECGACAAPAKAAKLAADWLFTLNIPKLCIAAA